MQITQADFRTVHIRKDGLSFFLRYNLYQDGEERFPESINCREDSVVAYFLTSTIRDFIRETAWGFSVERSWKIVPEGQFALTFCLDLPEPAAYSLLLPAAAASSGAELPARGLAAAGQDTAIPNGAYLLGATRSVLVFSDPLPGAPGPGSVSGRCVTADEEWMLRTEIRLPGLTSAEPEDTLPAIRAAEALPPEGPAASRVLPGRRRLRANPALQRSVRCRWQGVPEGSRGGARAGGPPRTSAVDSAVQGGQACGRGEHPELSRLPSGPDQGGPRPAYGAAGYRALFGSRGRPREPVGGDASRRRTSWWRPPLRLADFTLRGQHPGGLFYGTYRLREGSWLPPGAGPESPPQIRIDETAQIACSLLGLAERLQALGRPGNRYHMAGERVGEAMLRSRTDLAEVGAALHPDSLLSVGDPGDAIALLELFLQLHRRSGRDAHKKAAAALFRRFFGEAPLPYAAAFVGSAEPEGGADSPPASGSGDGARADARAREQSSVYRRLSLEAALRKARIAALLFESGYRPRGLEEYLGRLLPWVCVNPRPPPG